MKQRLGRAARKILPANVYWWARYGVPGQIRSRFDSLSPRVQSFSASDFCELHKTLATVNVLRPTRLCRLMASHGSDKSFGRLQSHNYTSLYNALFRGMRSRPIRIFELGLGTNNPLLPSTMGTEGRPGASLRAWGDFFPSGALFGADIDREILFHEDRIATYFCDQLDPAVISQMWSAPALREGLDIIVEDGLHTFDANTCFFENSIHKLRAGGFYVIEDIAASQLDAWRIKIEDEYLPMHRHLEFHVVQIPNPKNDYDNNLVIAHNARASEEG